MSKTLAKVEQWEVQEGVSGDAVFIWNYDAEVGNRSTTIIYFPFSRRVAIANDNKLPKHMPKEVRQAAIDWVKAKCAQTGAKNDVFIPRKRSVK